LLDEVGIITYEQVHIYNISNGHRFITYAIPGFRGSRTISINGAAARLAHINDRIIIAAYGIMDEDLENIKPKVVVLDENNQIVEKKGSLVS